MKNKTVLVVEDEKSYQNILSEKLKQESFSVIYAENGEDGYNIAIEYKPDLILLDIRMPVVSGLEMLKKLRSDEWGKTAEVIMLTTFDDAKSVSEAVDCGVVEYYVKTSITIDDLIKKVKEKFI